MEGGIRVNGEFGCLESAQMLLMPGRAWDQLQLLRAAEEAQLKNTGWPLGLVLTAGDSAPVPTQQGIEWRFHRQRNDGGPGWEDYWRFERDGRYFVARVFEEQFSKPDFQTSVGHPEKPLWFDVRVWRIAEAILHSARLYRALGVPPSEPYLLAVNHTGLAGREFWVSRAGFFVRRGRISRAGEAKWSGQVTQDVVETQLSDLVKQVGRGLFALFDFEEVPDESYELLVGEFSRSRL